MTPTTGPSTNRARRERETKAKAKVKQPRKVNGGASFLIGWRLSGKHVLVVGGGKEASGRVFFALDADARVSLVCPTSGLNPEVATRIHNGEVVHIDRDFVDEDLDGVDMVLSCIDDHRESRRIALLARAKRIPVNCADIPDLCDFYFFAQHRDGPIQFGVSTNACGPRLGARLRDMLASALPANARAAVEKVGQLRARVRATDPNPESCAKRMRWLSQLCDSWSFEEMAALNDHKMNEALDAYERGETAKPSRQESSRHSSTLSLVGAGPGDPGLLSVRAHDLLRTADMVMSDQLVPPQIIALIPPRRLQFVPKKAAGKSDASQDTANQTCLAALSRGLNVVRLKGGDPFLFGRGGEEVIYFTNHGYEVQVVPGISSCIAAPESAMIPVTHRGVADQVLILSGRGEGGAYPDIPSFYEKRTTVILMAVARLADLVERMTQKGYPQHLPVAVVEKGCWGDEHERVIKGTLENISLMVKEANVGAPALLVVGGAVNALQDRKAGSLN
ncbi:tetrapyrrole methylase [Gaertneriomyces semiglobifer]|nr:tetrapyrrole methylase [Gaertneriomyces semiglobifer]